MQRKPLTTRSFPMTTSVNQNVVELSSNINIPQSINTDKINSHRGSDIENQWEITSSKNDDHQSIELQKARERPRKTGDNNVNEQEQRTKMNLNLKKSLYIILTTEKHTTRRIHQ